MVGQHAELYGWVQIKREHGGVVFVDLRDSSGVVQLVFNETYNSTVFAQSSELKPEYVIRAAGEVRKRENPNPNIPTGHVEMWVNEISVLNSSETPPIGVVKQEDVSEEIRLRYRYIDLRREEMRNNILMRHRVTQAVIRYLDKKGYINIETPFLTKSTPEGARDFLVPSRLNRGKFYALPQSPQIFKQLLMVSGFERYFQIVKCFRDEDLRADRQPEFTQIDIEASFIDENDMYELVDGMFQSILSTCYKKSMSIPVQRISYDEAMHRYGTDRPDLRIPFHLFDISSLKGLRPGDLVAGKVEEGKGFYGLLLPLNETLSRKVLDGYTTQSKEANLDLFTWMKVNPVSGNNVSQDARNITGPMVKLFQSSVEDHVESFIADGISDASLIEGKPFIILAALGETQSICSFLGKLRTEKGQAATKKDDFRFCWIVDFPLFEWSEEEGRMVSVHHPFTSPKIDDFDDLMGNAIELKSRSYDFVLNGIELGGGSIRIHRREVQEKVFELLGLNQMEASKKFGFLLEALQYGAPPHGGIAFGLDRIVMMLQGMNSIRDVIPFPKTSSGLSPLSGAPDDISDVQLAELGLQLKK